MKKALLSAMVAAFFVGSAAFSQAPKPGPVWETYYYHIKPGQEDAFWKDYRENAKPIFDEAKQKGIVVDYKIFTNPLRERAGDWDAMLALAFPRYGTLDELEAQIGPIFSKHYGSPAAAADAAKKRQDIRETIAIHLLREMQ